MEITNETRYFQPEDKYMEFYQEVDFDNHIRKELIEQTNYNSVNITTSLLTSGEILFLNEVTGVDVTQIEIINFWR